MRRLQGKMIRASSTFVDRATAEQVVSGALRNADRDVQAWMATSVPKLIITARSDDFVGVTIPSFGRQTPRLTKGFRLDIGKESFYAAQLPDLDRAPSAMTPDMEELWPTLYAIAQLYYNEEWPDDYGTAAAVVDAFVERHPSYGDQLAAEINQVLAIYSEEEMQGFFEAIDLNVAPTADLCTHRVWLTQLALRATGRESAHGHQFEESPRHNFDVRPWPALRSLGTQYFRDGWLDRYGLSPYVLDAFMSEQPALAVVLPDEIDTLLTKFREDELRGLLHSLGFAYDPTESLNTNRGWLAEMGKHVRRALNDQR